MKSASGNRTRQIEQEEKEKGSNGNYKSGTGAHNNQREGHPSGINRGGGWPTLSK